MDFEKTLKILDEFGDFIVTNYKKHLEEEKISNGELYRTVSYTVSTGNSSWVVTISLADYWRYVEYGRKPGKMPPRNVIENWIKVKQIIPQPMTLSSGKTVVPTIPQLAFLIARKIGRDGIAPRPLFKDSFEESKKQFIEKIKEAIEQDVKRGLSD